MNEIEELEVLQDFAAAGAEHAKVTLDIVANLKAQHEAEMRDAVRMVWMLLQRMGGTVTLTAPELERAPYRGIDVEKFVHQDSGAVTYRARSLSPAAQS